MKTYDQEQLRAINADGGYFLVLAPPGCGKTDILSERIVCAKEMGVDFEDMLCLTFTNRASRGMRDRVRQKIGDEANGIFVGNVHRYCSNFIYNNGIVPENSSIIDEEDMADILRGFNDTFFLNRRGSYDRDKIKKVDDLDGYISQLQLKQPDKAIYISSEDYDPLYQIAKTASFDANNVDENIDDDHKIVKYTLFFKQYKAEKNIITFSDILILAYEGLRNDRNKEYKRFKWIQIDEVQDLNSIQMAIIDELLDTSGHFTVMYLGDEQQAIFSFLGAKLSQLDLLKQRCAGNILTLGKNYRSPKYLLDICNTYAEKELNVDSAILPQATRDEPHGKFDLLLVDNDDDVAEDKRVKAMIDYYLKFDEERVAILVAKNIDADRISEELTKENVSHFKISGTDMFKLKSYKTLASLFCVNANEFNFLSWSRLLHGINAFRTGADAREFLMDLKNRMMTPSDLMNEQSYVAQFDEEYQQREFVFFDTETTGLNVLEDDIVQIAAFKVLKGERVPGSDFNIFIHTDREIPQKLGDKINPLIDAYANNPHYSHEEGLRLFMDYIGNCPVLGHNVNYDYRILQYNVERYLHEQITLDIYDSLKLIKCVEPHLRMYKLEFLLKELNLQGKNSHLADEDIAATKALVDYCVRKSKPVIPGQKTFVAQKKVQNVKDKLQMISPIIDNLQEHLYQPTTATNRTIADDLKSVYDDLISLNVIDDLGEKFNIFLRYVQNEWIDYESEETVFDQISKHINDITSSINEGDLVNSEELINERVFIMTVYKGKGLEFDNVVILGANDDTYPFFAINKVLKNQYKYTQEQIAKALLERKEDARKFYVAISRAKKRLCISYTHRNAWGFPTTVTPFIQSIQNYFYTGKKSN